MPQLPDTFIVNLGDMLQQWTNGKFQSTLHRVVNLVPGHERYSCAFFVSPSWDAKVRLDLVSRSDSRFYSAKSTLH